MEDQNIQKQKIKNQNMEEIVRADKVKLCLKGTEKRFYAVDGVSFSLFRGKTLGIIGESGSGKTLLCHVLLDLLEKDKWEMEGSICWRPGFSVRNAGLIVQNPLSAFNPRMKLSGHFQEMTGVLGLKRREISEDALRLLYRTGIRDPKRVLESYAFELSGGMLQRVMIALALLGKPKLLIADEPTTALDVTTQWEILDLLNELQQEYGLSILMVSHDLKVIQSMAEDICVMNAGSVVEQGAAEEVLKMPLHPYTCGLLASRRTYSRTPVKAVEYCPPEIRETTQNPVIFQAEGIKKSYRTAEKARKAKEGKIHAVNDFFLQVKEGECRGIVGESGCGKSTLLRILSGLEKPDRGSVLYQGKSVFEQMKTRRNEIQLIFQNSLNAVNPYACVEDILGEPLKNFGDRKRTGKKTKREQQEKAVELLVKVGLSKKDLRKYPGQFSGGQLQRICIARALAAEPRVLLLDEPWSSLDASVQVQMMRLLEKLGKEHRLTQILVSHDLEAVYSLSDSLTVMYGGYIVEEIEEIKLFNQLCHPYTKRLVQTDKGNCLKYRWEAVNEIKGADDVFPEAGYCPYVHMCLESTEICRKELPPLVKLYRGHWVRCFHFRSLLTGEAAGNTIATADACTKSRFENRKPS